MDKRDAEAITARIKSKMGDLMAEVAKAYIGRAWVALGYESWDDYIKGEFHHAPLVLPREERRAVVALLRGQGMSTRAIGAATGVHHDTVSSDLRGVGNPTPDEAPPVIGQDGKPYPAQPPPKKPRKRTPQEVARREADASFAAIGSAVDQLDGAISVLGPEHGGAAVQAADADLLNRAREALQRVIEKLSATGERPGATVYSWQIQHISASIAEPCDTFTDDQLAEALGAAEFLYLLLRGATILRGGAPRDARAL
ncbi:helix-turn-helix domain-containing protein [Mycobacterium sp. E3198]|uniref:helix-turn-helix domain-containing protein n=1 Tax=Mycobacterium sp. E3198 TaxID=1834143 RepID=UPI0012EA6824|nr:helix-turn-helix domain-containing protein [Mycobacterium sp. E3198]